jgi:hypothetical protein
MKFVHLSPVTVSFIFCLSIHLNISLGWCYFHTNKYYFSALLVRKYQILVHKITPKFDISAPIVQKYHFLFIIVLCATIYFFVVIVLDFEPLMLFRFCAFRTLDIALCICLITTSGLPFAGIPGCAKSALCKELINAPGGLEDDRPVNSLMGDLIKGMTLSRCLKLMPFEFESSV